MPATALDGSGLDGAREGDMEVVASVLKRMNVQCGMHGGTFEVKPIELPRDATLLDVRRALDLLGMQDRKAPVFVAATFRWPAPGSLLT